jgi:hypothetical protein
MSTTNPTSMWSLGITVNDLVRYGVVTDDRVPHQKLAATMADAFAPDAAAAERLDTAANIYQNASEDRSSAMADLKRCIRECAEVGIPKLKIAQLAGVSRQTVYDTLREGQL